MPSFRRFLAIAFATTVPLAATAAGAQEFSAVVSPPRFEITVNPGERSRQVVEITNAASQPSTYTLRTADWTLAPDGGVSFSDELVPGSCRPWVAIERREVVVPAGGRLRFRFEIEPPVEATAGECRFALMIEGAEQTVRTPAGLNVPVSGRIAVIVYAGIGEAEPDLQVASAGIVEVNGRAVPAFNVSNTGNAHGRLAGFLSGTDAQGRRLEFSPSTMPILPGESRLITLIASDGTTEITDVAFPVTVAGVLEWGTTGRAEINQQFSR